MTSEIEELRDRLDSFDDRYAAMKYGLGALNDTVEQLKFTVYNTTRSDAFREDVDLDDVKNDLLNISKIQTIEDDLANLKMMFSGDVSETTKRAITLRDAVETSGMITRRQAQSILGNCHHNIATRAMEQAAEMFQLIFIKNGQGRWVLAAK